MRLRRIKLAAALAALATVWLLLLPYASRTPAMQERIQWLETQGVDPSAMYYTELDMMQPLLERMAVEKRLSRR